MERLFFLRICIIVHHLVKWRRHPYSLAANTNLLRLLHFLGARAANAFTIRVEYVSETAQTLKLSKLIDQ